MFLFVGVLMALAQGGYTRRIPAGREKTVALRQVIKTFSEFSLGYYCSNVSFNRGLILIIPSFAIIGFAYNLWTLYAGLALYALSTSVCVPCMTTLVSTYGDASQKGIVTGVFRFGQIKMLQFIQLKLIQFLRSLR